MKRPQRGLAAVYSQQFYDGQVPRSLDSARVILGFLYTVYRAASVIDVGCGRGTWLKVCQELGASMVKGLDGYWNSQSKMLDPRIEFEACDLGRPFHQVRKYDLALCLEVAEHLPLKSAPGFVTSTAGLSDVLLFGAAVPGQGGTNHVNERYQSFWGELFAEAGFDVYDLFRPALWGDDRVAFWYLQNVFLYVKRGHPLATTIATLGQVPLTDLRFMDCIHPRLHEMKMQQAEQVRIYASTHMGFKKHIADLVPSFLRALKYRVTDL